jgi:RNA polymerase sigma factor (sigma-70 family)
VSTGVAISEEAASSRGRVYSQLAHREQSDVQLISRVARGDDDALAELYDRHGRLAYGVALRVTRDSMLAQDAVQEAFVALWRTAPQFDPRRASVAGWIVLLVRRRAIDLGRRETRSTRALHTWPPELESPAAEHHALTRLESARARVALRGLAPEQRAVLQLAYYDGLSQSEIATALEIPIGTVKSRTFAALEHLRTALSAPS